MVEDEAALAEGGVAGRLARPLRRLAVEDLAAEWFTGHVRLVVEGLPPGVALGALAGRVRGALGAVLQETASAEAVAGLPCPWRPPSALDLLFRSQGRLTKAMEIPKPMLIALDPDGRRLAVEVGLTGFASECLEEVAAALVRAWRERIPDVAGSRLVDRQIWSSAGVVVPEAAVVILEFTSPLAIRFKGAGPASADAALWSLLASLGNRVSGLARWQDCEVAADWTGLKALAAGVAMRCLASSSARWERRSFRQDRRIPMAGDVPVLRLEGALGPFLPWLALGTLTHVGSHAALGMGRYRLLVED